MKTAKLLVLLTVGLFLAGCVVADRDSQRRGLEGTWYSGGARDKATSIVSTRGGWEARNEHGQTSRLVSEGRNSVVALDWGGGTRAEIRGDRIEWANGTYWTRRPN